MSADRRRLILHDTLATAPFAIPLLDEWILPPANIELVIEPTTTPMGASENDILLILLAPVSEAVIWQETHVIEPSVASVAGSVGSVAMRVPVRPDNIERTPIRLWQASGAAELLARATIRPFYGIEPQRWIETEADAADAQVVVVEGVEALRPPEAGFAEDLCRAWFVLTGTPAVSHVLLVPRDLPIELLCPAMNLLARCRRVAHQRRREVRQRLADRYDLPVDLLAAFMAGQRLDLDSAARRGLLLLLVRGTPGSRYPAPAISFRDTPNVDR